MGYDDVMKAAQEFTQEKFGQDGFVDGFYGNEIKTEEYGAGFPQDMYRHGYKAGLDFLAKL